MSSRLLKKLFAGVMCAALAFTSAAVPSVDNTVYAATTVPSMKNSSFTLVAGAKAKAFKATDATLQKFKVYKASVEKAGGKKVANIAINKNSSGIRLRALDLGNTSDVMTNVRVRFWSISAKKKTKAYVYPVTIKPASAASSSTSTSGTSSSTGTTDAGTAATTVTAGIAKIEQPAVNKIKITFGDSKTGLAVENFAIVNSNNENLFISGVETATDGKSCVVTADTPFVAGVKYKVTENKTNTALEFTARTYGVVTDAEILTSTVPVGRSVTLSYVLYDAAKMDVTASVDLSAKVSVSADGASYFNGDSTNPVIKMDSVGDEATVSVTYDAQDGTNTYFTKTKKIKCVDASEISSTGYFYKLKAGDSTSDAVNTATGCAKFYLGLKDSAINLSANGGSGTVYFYSPYKDEGAGAVDFDSYDVKASNESVAYAGISGAGNGKFASIEVEGRNAGSTQMTVTAEKNGKKYTYTIPIKVVDDLKASNLEVTLSRSSMSNAFDDDYYGTVTVKAYSSSGELLGSDIDYVEVDSNLADNKEPITFDDNTGIYKAAGASAGTHTIKITAYGLTKSVNVSVQDVLTNIKRTNSYGNNSGLKLSYKVELTNKELVLADRTADSKLSTTARLYAVYGSSFVGYVKGDGRVGDGSGENEVLPSVDTMIEAGSISMYAQKNNNIYGSSSLWETANAVSLSSGDEAVITYTMLPETGKITYSTDSSCISGVAAAGNYTAKFSYKKGNTASSQTAQESFSVNFKLTMPKVNVLTTKVSSASAIIQEAISTDVDVNNNSGASASVVNLYSKFNTLATSKTSNSGRETEYVKYAGVTDYRSGVEIEFYANVSTTFATS